MFTVAFFSCMNKARKNIKILKSVSFTKSKKYFSSETNSTYIWGENKINDIYKFKEISYQMIEDIISFKILLFSTKAIPTGSLKKEILVELNTFSLILVGISSKIN